MSAALAWRGSSQRGALALGLGALAGWLVLRLPSAQVALPLRMWPALLALAVAFVPQRWRLRAGLLTAALAPLVPLWVWLGNRGLALGLLWWAAMAGSTALAGWGLSRMWGKSIGAEGRAAQNRGGSGSTAVLAISAAAAAVLLGLTGSQSLATEAMLPLAALLPWVRRPLAQTWTFALLLGSSLWLGLHLSGLGWAALVPLAVLLCLPLGRVQHRRAGALAAVAAALVAAAGVAPVLVDWVRDPPF